MSISSFFGHSASKELAAKQAAEIAAKKAAQNAAKDEVVNNLRKELTVTAESPVNKIFDSFKRSSELVYSDGRSFGGVNRGEAAQALLEKEVYHQKRWQLFPEEEYTKISGSFSSNTELSRSLFEKVQASNGSFSGEITTSLMAPMAPAKASGALWSNKPLIIHDKVTGDRLPVSNLDELFKAAEQLLK